jgi:TolB-like protein
MSCRFATSLTISQTDYLSLALPEELDAQLSRTTSIIIPPLDSVRANKDQAPTVEEVAKALQVGTVVEGDFWLNCEQLRVHVNIIDSKQNRQVWSEQFQTALADLLAWSIRRCREWHKPCDSGLAI